MSLEAIRSVRLQGSAVFDWALTFLGAFLIQKHAWTFLSTKLGFVSPLQFYASMVPLALAAHWLTGQRTHMWKEVMEEPKEVNFWKLVFIVSVVVVFYEAFKMKD